MYGFDSYVALGDSFTEGLNDALPDGSFRGWADRLAEILAAGRSDFRYANLSLRGKMLDEIMDEQLPIALELKPDLVTLCAAWATTSSSRAPTSKRSSSGSRRASRSCARPAIPVLIFNGPDTKVLSVMSVLRGKVAIYNTHLWAIAERHGARMVDLWTMGPLHDRRAWSDDRLHFSPEAHRRIALKSAEVLGIPVASDWREPWPSEDTPSRWIDSRRSDLAWTKVHLLPWIRRQLRGESMGDGLSPKRPQLAPLVPIEVLEAAENAQQQQQAS